MSQPSDPEEREAASLAERIVGGLDRASPSGGPPRISRSPAAGPRVSRQPVAAPSAAETLADRKLAGYAAAIGRLLGEDAPREQRDLLSRGLEELHRIIAGPAGIDQKRRTIEGLEAAIQPVLPGAAPRPRQERLQRSPVAGGDRPAERSADVDAGIARLSGRGEPLAPALRGLFEERLGHDLGSVRIHRDAESATLADRLDALAFTVGGHVAFARGRYDPGSRQGLTLLAHELTHTVQQGAASALAGGTPSGVAPVHRLHSGVGIARQMNTACAGTSRYPGNFEHLLIESNYTTVINPIFGEAEFSIPNGNETGTDTGYADLVDVSLPAIYEIKPWVGRSSGVAQVERYRDAAQLFCDPEQVWLLGALYPFTIIPISATQELVSAQSEHLGVVGYWYRARVPPPVPVPVPEERRVTEERRERVRIPEPVPTPWWVPVGAAAAYILWNSKGCLAGPWGCVIDWATPGI